MESLKSLYPIQVGLFIKKHDVSNRLSFVKYVDYINVEVQAPKTKPNKERSAVWHEAMREKRQRESRAVTQMQGKWQTHARRK